ncbi:MAG: ABC transporter substrate-binding protein [Calditrichaeota bacterium]|nr:ABC transporter substrate-binding protein [Calditrichota bacterium]
MFNYTFHNLSRFVLLFTVFVFTVIGCGSGERPGIKVHYEKVDTPPGALPDVPAELGGEGFTGEGWLTNADYEGIGDPRAVPGGTFTMAIFEFPATLRTIGKDSNSEFIYLIDNLVYESLMGIHSMTMQYVPGLATHWKISEDKQTFWFRLDPRARFADGSRVTTEDVIASWKLRVDEKILAPYSNILWSKFDEPVAESPYIIRVSCKELNWRFFIYFGGMNILPAKYIASGGENYMKEFQFKMPPGSGLYEIEHDKIIKQKVLSLRKRQDYWDKDNPKGKGVGNFDRLKFVVVNDERLMFEKFKKGETDFYQVGRAQWWREECDFDNVKRGLVQKRKIYNDDPQGISGVVFNMRVEPFNDIRMRKAIVHLLNREKLNNELFFKEYTFLDSYFPGGIYENPDNPKYRYDPDLAVKLLAECGWNKRNAEGWLTNAKGQTIELELAYASVGSERIFTVFQEDLKKVGIKLNLKQTQGSTLFKMVNERKFIIHWQSWGGLFFPNPENDVSSWTADVENTNNLAGVKNPEIDSLCKVYNITFDQEERVKIIRRIDRILMDIQPFALAWYAPFHRILYWSKLDAPEYYFTRTGDWRSALSLWWLDPEKEKALEKARKDKSINFPVGETDVMYWPEYNKTHGQQYTIKE